MKEMLWTQKMKREKMRSPGKGRHGKMISAIYWENTTNKFRDAMIDDHRCTESPPMSIGGFYFQNYLFMVDTRKTTGCRIPVVRMLRG